MNASDDGAPPPGRVVGRRFRRVLNSGYSQHGASRIKKSMVGWATSQGSPDGDITDNLDVLRERSRDLFMGEALAAGAIRTIVANEIGAGLKLNCRINAAKLGLDEDAAMAWEDNVEREFEYWSSSRECDAARRHTFGELTALARTSQLLSGDVFALFVGASRPGDRFGVRLQLIEGDRVKNPPIIDTNADVVGGVEVDEFGAPVAYWITRRHPGDALRGSTATMTPNQYQRLPAFGEETGRPLVLHLLDADRPGQRRGAPLFAPVMERVKQLSRYIDAELTAAVVSGFFTAAITSETPQTPIGRVLPPEDAIEEDEDEDVRELAPGLVLGLNPGESITSINPSRPNSGFDPFVVSLCRQIGAGIGLPYELLVKQFDASYSASRAAILEAWKHFTVGRARIVEQFCQPSYEEWLADAVTRGIVVAPGFFDDPIVRAAWCGAEWIGPSQGQLDPTKEVEAAKMRIAEGLSTRTREARELGCDFWDNHRLRVAEEEARVVGKLATGQGGQVQTLVLTPTSQEAIVTVDEGRASVGQPPVGGEEGGRYIAEHRAKMEADLAPEIAEGAAAKQGRSETTDPNNDTGNNSTEDQP